MIQTDEQLLGTNEIWLFNQRCVEEFHLDISAAIRKKW
jgi:hypothetical protein